ncbi:MAG TPA: hypothetical protein VM869_04395 [Enhygromyxa sp.]|nr:hypothetical protein [Enhygromyxa sp.]
MDEHEIGIALAHRELALAVALDLATTIDGRALDRTPDPEDVEGQPRVFVKQREDSLVERARHAWLVGLRIAALQTICRARVRSRGIDVTRFVH